jgi:5-methyltetrahydrofolate--homocysteine methyltransferase
MVYVAQEMERTGFQLPLLIGGATTSRTHTAVKIEPGYSGSTTYVPDASRAVAVVSGLLSDRRDAAMAETRAEYVKVREQFARGREQKARVALADARANRLPIDWKAAAPIQPRTPGVTSFAPYDLKELREVIDWTPFFASWDLVGRFPDILQDEIVGEAARDLYEDATRLLDRIVEERLLEARGVVGFWPANADGDDIVLYADESRTAELGRLHTLRQQIAKSEGKANVALSDFVAPIGAGPDWVGGFAVTAGHGETELAQAFKAAGDDYSAIMVAALADRLAEAFAERLHQRVRTELWGYAPAEALPLEDILAERYQGIRPAPGYPAQPDHTEKELLFQLLDAEANTGAQLTESFAMTPGAAVCGLYFAHPQAHYFGVGKIEQDQVADYARRKAWPLGEAERWLAPILNYEPGKARAPAEAA